MKLSLSKRTEWECRSGFTLAESLVAMATMVLVIGGMVAANMFGLAMAVRQQIWLSASDDGARALGKLMTDIRSGASNYVGSYTSNGLAGWTMCPVTTNQQQGNALLCYQGNTSGGTNAAWVIYYYDSVSNILWRTNYTGSNYGDFDQVSANPITNDYSIFREYDYLMNPITNNTTAQPIIQVYLSFTKLQNPQIVIAPGNPVDFYQIITYAASRNVP
jgi:type II secretory pathway pseudopilin PulG